MVRRSALALALALVLALAAPAAAGCRLALALALDVSSSVDAAEDALQRGGLAGALLAPEVQAAFFAVPGQSVALGAYEWSGRYQQTVILPWTVIESPEALRRAAGTIAASRRSHADFPTALGYALGFGAGFLRKAPDCLFRTLDVSGDGRNNEGFPPALAYRHFPFSDITVNGLAIAGGAEDITAYYRAELIHGPGAFVQEAAGFADYERAMRRKLERELRPPALGATRWPGFRAAGVSRTGERGRPHGADAALPMAAAARHAQ
ncbi:MAG: DUF1194 domain-containing protein [Alphaproteobacteria bacterium]|nr:MAG: DUF1194 domain-containing protein [Alphaproteobacteria bacterium]